MKKIFLGTLLLLSSSSAFANLEDCSNLLGKYKGSYQGASIVAEVTRTSIDTIKIALNNEGGSFVVDGKSHKSSTDDTTYVATCSKESGLLIQSSFQGKEVGTVKVQAMANGIQYLMQQGNEVLSLKLQISKK